MPVHIKKTAFDSFFENRDALNYQYTKGDISKKEYIEEHYYYIMQMKLKPFQKIDSFEKGIYNYQYYNAVAKYNRMRSRDRKLMEKHPELVGEIEKKIQEAYRHKDDTVRRLIRFLDYENMEAYYIKAKSDYLNNKLFEIVLYDYDSTILHSINPGIVNELKREGVFQAERKKSKIDDYVNRKY